MNLRRTAAVVAIAAVSFGVAPVAQAATTAPASAPAAVSAAATAKAPATVKIGSRSPAVNALQTQLVDLGHPMTADGAYGTATANAVKAEQRLNQIPVTGVVDARTWNMLGFRSTDYRDNSGAVLRQGSRGTTVKLAQMLLSEMGAPVKADGVFGATTTTAVKTLQRAHRLPVDGIVGASTWNILFTAAK